MRNRVRPTHAAVEADDDTGHADQPGAVGVVDAGDGQVFFPKTSGAVPGVVRVGQEKTAAVLRARAGQRPGVGAHVAPFEFAQGQREFGRLGTCGRGGTR